MFCRFESSPTGLRYTLLVIVAFLASCGLAAAQTPIGFAQGAYAVPQTPQSVVTVAYPSAQSAGDLNVVVIGWNDATSQVVSVTDARGNVYTQALATVQPGIQSQRIYYAGNIAAGANTVTVTFNTAVSFPDVRL